MNLALVVVVLCAGFAVRDVTAAVKTAHISTDGRLALRITTLSGQVISCEVYTDSEVVKEILALIPERYQVLTDDTTFQTIVDSCLLPHATQPANSRRKRQVMFPGTKWCGLGNTAANYDDLGVNEATDKCCRAHDNCPIHLQPDATDYGITNDRPYTISDCSCDQDFQSCLKQVGSASAGAVEFFFFTTMRMPCLAWDHPETCTGVWIWQKCTADTSKPKQWIIRENP